MCPPLRCLPALGPFAAITRAWSGVVQGQTGIGEAWWSMENNSVGAEEREQTHRFYLQADCLVGVSAKGLGRELKSLKPVVAAMEPREYAESPVKWNGKPANRLYWLKKGYESGKPGACNTWTASSAKVS